MKNYTLEILEREARAILRRERDADPEQREMELQREAAYQSFLRRYEADQSLLDQVIGLLDAQGVLDAVQQRKSFHLGLQMGLELGCVNFLSEEE